MIQASRLLFVVALAAAFPARAGKIVKNSSFEKPVVEDGGFQLIPAGDQFAGWTVVGSGNVAIFYSSFGINLPGSRRMQMAPHLTADHIVYDFGGC